MNVFGFLKKSPTWSVAFTREGPSLVWAAIKNTSDGPLLRAFGTSSSAEKALNEIQGVARDKVYITSVFPSIPTLCRSLVLPQLKEREVPAALIDSLDQTTSLNMEESVLAYESNQAKDGSWTILSFMTQRGALEEHLSTIKAHGVDPEPVIPKASCLAAFAAHFALEGWQYIVDVGAEETTVVLSFEKKVVESSSLVGGKNIFDAIDSPTNEDSLYQLLQHLREITAAYKERYDLPGTTTLTITGTFSPIAVGAIEEAIGAPLSALHTADPKTDTSFLQCASSVGAAFLSGLDTSNAFPDFRSNAFAFSRPLLHWKKPLIALCAFSALLAGSLVWYGNERAAAIAHSMNSDWQQITAVSHTTPEGIVNAAEKEGLLFDQEELHSPSGLVRQGDWFLSDIEKRTLFPLHPDFPRLSDFLLWLTERIEEAQKEEGSDLIYLEGCHYVLASRPSKAHPLEKYQVRVDLDVSTSSPVAARALHNRLLSQNPFVDPSLDVKWSGNNNRYRASFVLKDKTVYPTREP